MPVLHILLVVLQDVLICGGQPRVQTLHLILIYLLCLSV